MFGWAPRSLENDKVSTKRQQDPNAPTLMSYAAAQGHTDAPRAPLPERMRPSTLDEIVGQTHLLGPNGSLRRAILSDRVPSMILWGGPGSGKTTLAHVVSRVTKSHFEPFSAVLGGVADLRRIIGEAKDRRNLQGKGTLLFVDEIHRFNRAQQDAFLPHVENGTVTLIGATTENPSFAVNAAILSRSKVFRLRPLEDDQIARLLRRAINDERNGLGRAIRITDEALALVATAGRGDARRALNQLDALADYAARTPEGHDAADAGMQRDLPEAVLPREISRTLLAEFADDPTLLYDKSGEEHYNVTSALIKSMRGSDPDAAIYYLMRMLDAGDDPLFVLRRLMIFASEDVGNADPRALQVAVSADAAFRRIGMPEGLYPIAQACLYLACCPKSNSVGTAFTQARELIKRTGALPVPPKFTNASTSLMKDHGYGVGYQYAHDHPGNFVRGETYLPDAITGTMFYEPSDQGLETQIRDRLKRLRSPGTP